VVAASQGTRIAGRLKHDGAAAVAANVVMGVDRAFRVTDEDDRFAGEREKKKVARLRNLRRVTRHDPVIAEDAFPIALEHSRVRIESLVE
jgi:hypothetical protein